ncbi:MAG: recombination regulator RecX [Oscillospiraceae bacterium]|nr:recombination regulator RecX [Oscillospiraceae bacterium]
MIELSNDFDKAKAYALKLLSMRDYSGGELLNKLNKTYGEETCLAALERVRDLGYQDDFKYAEKLAAYLVETKYYGIRRVSYEMKLKGLSAETIAGALEKYTEDEIPKKIIEVLNRKYLNIIKGLDSTDRAKNRRDLKKIIDALARRGYEYNDIKAGIERVCEDMEIDYE